MDAQERDDDDFWDVRSTPEEVTAEFQEQVRELGGCLVELTDQMKKLGDYRPYNAIMEDIQRMVSGEKQVSAEMKVIVTMMLRQQLRLKHKYAELVWTREDGSYLAQADDFRISLIPQTRSRWLVSLIHKDGYRPPWPRWQDNLEAAKRRALVCMEEAAEHLAEGEFHRMAETTGS